MSTSIFTITTSEDGLDNYYYTNIKALYNGILETGLEPKTVLIYDGNNKRIEKSFNYANLTNLIRSQQSRNRFCVAIIECESGGIDVNELSKRAK